MGLHTIVLLIPVVWRDPYPQSPHAPIELELTTVAVKAPAIITPEPEVKPTPPEPAPEAVAESLPEPPDNPLATQTVAASPAPEPPETGRASRDSQRGLERMSEVEKTVLTSTILARQYITEDSAVDRLFGKPVLQVASDSQKDFHYPLRPDLLEMLDQPLPDVPFAYTPDLIHFAYEPGVRGDLQRFWDVITPEFGWRTKYGTEVRCALILVIVGCAWK